jgi:Flp pilus assembly pilin Flp
MKGGESAMTLRNWFTMFSAFARREDGQTMAEYAVILTVIAAIVITALGFLVAAITGRLDDVTAVING